MAKGRPYKTTMTLTSVLHAPRSLVFKAWTDPSLLAQWWGPRGFTNPVCEVDVWPGGGIRIHMRAPDAVEHPMIGVYREIIEPELLVFTSSPLDNKGRPLFEVLSTVTFAGNEGKGDTTTLIMRASVSKVKPQATRHLQGMEEGWRQSVDRLEALVGKMVREGRSTTLPNLIEKWSSWGPHLQSMLRIVAAFTFMLAGTVKLIAFPLGIPPNGGTVQLFSEIGIGGVLEAFGGCLLLLGLYTRPVAFILSGEMAVAYFQFHFPHGFWPVLNGGLSAMMYCFVWLYFSAAGAGPWSMDAWRENRAKHNM